MDSAIQRFRGARKSSIKWALPLLLVLAAICAEGASAQQAPTLELRLIRTFGYGGINQIEGNFALRLSEPPPLTRAEFLMDGQVVHTATEAPFEYRFNTSQYPPGVHTMSALGYTPAGEALASNSITTEFITAEDARSATVGLVVPLIVLTFGLIVAGSLLTAFITRRRGYTPGQYGNAGGAICPRCGMPYSRHILSPNLVAGKLERCPHCGKWAIVSRASPQALQQAERRLREGSLKTESSPESEEERLRRMLDESRFDEP